MYTCIENLSTELWLIIFRFLSREDLISAFSKLNSRFDSLLASPHLPTIFRVQIEQCDAYPNIQSINLFKNLKFEWIQSLETSKRVSGGCLTQFIRYQTPRLINLRLLNISIRAKGASKNLDYLTKALSQLYSLKVLKLQCKTGPVDRTITIYLVQLFKTILQSSSLRYCTLHLWDLTEKNFDYEILNNLPSNQSIKYLHITNVDRTILFNLLLYFHGLKSFVGERNKFEDKFALNNPSDLMTSNLSCSTLSTVTLRLCNLRFDELEKICDYTDHRIRHIQLDYSVHVFTNHYEDYLDYFDQIRWTNLLQNIEIVNISIQIHALDDVAKDIISNMVKINSSFTWTQNKYRQSYACLIINNNPLIKSSSNEPECCCTPKQFSAKISLSTGITLPDGKRYTSYAHYNFSYDLNRGMIGMKGVSFYLPDQQPTKLWIIQNSNDGQIYTINIDTKQCQKSKNPIGPISCIPQTATYIDSSIYGYGDKQIIGDTWLFKMNGTINYSTVSRGNCIPLTSNMFMEKPPLVSALTTTNFVAHIDDPSVFDIPPECQHLF